MILWYTVVTASDKLIIINKPVPFQISSFLLFCKLFACILLWSDQTRLQWHSDMHAYSLNLAGLSEHEFWCIWFSEFSSLVGVNAVLNTGVHQGILPDTGV